MSADDSGISPTSSEVIAELTDAFDLAPPVGWRDLQVGWTRNILLESGVDRLVARIHQRSTSAERLLAMQAARVALADAGLPTVKPMQTPNGASCLILRSGQLTELEHYVESDAPMKTAASLRVGHGLMARMHDVLRAAALPAAADEEPKANSIASADAVAATRRGAERIRGWNRSDLSEFADRAVAHIEAVAEAEGPLRGDQQVQLTHGDFWDNNVLFANGRPVLLLDFDFLARRPRIDDLALTAYFYLLEPGRGVPGEQARRDVCSFLDAYDAAAALPLTPEERAAFPLAVARQPAWSVGGRVLELDDDRARAHAADAAREFRVAKAVLDDIDEWREAVATG